MDELVHPPITPHYVADFLGRAAQHDSVGMRACCFTLPLLFRLFGPRLLLLSTALPLLYLCRLDRAPDAGD